MNISFFKYQGTGNDFVIIDNRDGNIVLSSEQIHKVCDRRFGIGADGLMLLNVKEGYDFEMKYYNADGNESSMCGNGGRCLTQFAFDMGIKREKYRFVAADGAHEKFHGDSILNTGSPHFVKSVTDVMGMDVFKEGSEIRNSLEFATEGINVNFVEQTDEDRITVRTYERGVENETLSCGTGVTASALVFAHNETGFNRIEIKTLGGDLAVEFDKNGDNGFENIRLCGPANFVYKGEITI
jgi:diaminopimelate epimerase